MRRPSTEVSASGKLSNAFGFSGGSGFFGFAAPSLADSWIGHLVKQQLWWQQCALGKGGEVIICVLHVCVYALACGTYYCMTFWLKTFWHTKLPAVFFASGNTPWLSGLNTD